MRVRLAELDFPATLKAFWSPIQFALVAIIAACISPVAIITWYLYETSSTQAAVSFAVIFGVFIGLLRATYMAGEKTLIVYRYRTIDLGANEPF